MGRSYSTPRDDASTWCQQLPLPREWGGNKHRSAFTKSAKSGTLRKLSAYTYHVLASSGAIVMVANWPRALNDPDNKMVSTLIGLYTEMHRAMVRTPMTHTVRTCCTIRSTQYALLPRLTLPRVAITHCRANMGPPVAAPGHLWPTAYVWTNCLV